MDQVIFLIVFYPFSLEHGMSTASCSAFPRLLRNAPQIQHEGYSEGKQIAESDEMTFASGATIIVEVPTGAVKYYMWRHVDGEWLFSPDYYVKDTPLTLSKDSSLTLSTEGVGDWK